MSHSKASMRLTIVNRLGIHARAAAVLVKELSKFKSEITIRKGNDAINGKSIMGVLMLAAENGSTITVEAKGEDAEIAVIAAKNIVENRFGEDE